MKGVIHGFNPFGDQPPPVPAAPTTAYAGLPFYAALRACTLCSARAEAAQVVPGAGPLEARILVIGQNPGDEEDREGAPFIGQSGAEFDRWLQVLGLDRAKLMVTNVVKCHTFRNRVPRTTEIKTCAGEWLARELEALTAVSVLVPLGKPAVVAILGKAAPPMTPLMAHQLRVRMGTRDFRVFPLPHPAYLLRVRHHAPMFYETVLTHVRITMEADAPEAYTWTKK